jgi:DNA-binding SARP family transcriptional activator
VAVPEIEVAVLGPVEIRGAVRAFRRPAARELVVYLALHPNGARTDVWGAALWPDRSVAPSTLHSTVSAARRSLGQSEAGLDHLPRSGRHVRLGASVGTDVDRFARAAAEPDPARWREALELVRGALFEGLSRCDWAVFEGISAELGSMVTDTALRGAEHFLARGLGGEAEWMIRRALKVSPYDERLYRALLRAAEVQGNRMGVRSAMAELLTAAREAEQGRVAPCPSSPGSPSPSFVHPKTVALYRELAHGAAPEARGDPVRL